MQHRVKIPSLNTNRGRGRHLRKCRPCCKGSETIPVSTYSIAVTKDNEKKPRTGTIVGTSPFASSLSGSTINAVVIPSYCDWKFNLHPTTEPRQLRGPRRNTNGPVYDIAAGRARPNLTFAESVGTTQFTDGSCARNSGTRSSRKHGQLPSDQFLSRASPISSIRARMALRQIHHEQLFVGSCLGFLLTSELRHHYKS